MTPEETRLIVGAFGVHSYSPAEVSEALRDLTISHSILGWSKAKRWYTQSKVKARCETPPAWPVVCHSVSDIRRFRPQKSKSVLFVCDSTIALSYTNLTALPEAVNLHESLKKALLSPWIDWKFVSTEPSIVDYVAIATKPSFLRDVQTCVYRINPYSDRKLIQTALISYLGGRTSLKNVKKVLELNARTDQLKKLLLSEKAKTLIAATALAEKTGDAESAALKYNIDVFDINYVRASLDKT